MPGALAGLSVLDLTSQLSGPYCSMILADLGADVVKVERPGQGDESRAMGPHVAGESAPFMTFNRNKRSITIDLKTADGGAIARRLATRADVVLENWRPGTAARLGLGWDDVHALNARAIYCSISGFGQTGPYAQRGGFDPIAQGSSGRMSINGTQEGPPLPGPISVSDTRTRVFAAIRHARGPPRNEVHHRGDGGVAGATRGRRRAGGADPRLRPGFRGSPRASPRDGRRGRAPARGAIARARNPREALEYTGKHLETGAHARAAHRRGVEGAGLRRRGRG